MRGTFAVRAFLPVLCFVSVQGHAATPSSVGLTEKELVTLAMSSSPVIQSIEAAATSAQVENLGVRASYETRGQVSFQTAESDEEPLFAFQPTLSPTQSFSVGVVKNLPLGITTGVQVFGQQISTSTGQLQIDRATRTGVRVNLEVDLIRNFFGRLDKAALGSRRFASERAKHRSDLDRKAFEMDLRKLYWQLLGVETSLELSRQLKASAERQLLDAQSRARAGAADQGDVARNRAQVQSRQASILLFEYQREQLVARLKQLVPAVKDSEIRFAPVNLAKTVDQVLSCAAEIGKAQTVKPESSSAFEILRLLEKESMAEYLRADATNKWDLKLSSSIQKSNVGTGYSGASENFSDQSRIGYSLGAVLTVPLETTSSKLKESRVALVSSSYTAQMRSLELEISETHRKILNSLVLLQQAAAAQNQIVADLGTSLEASRRKYRQARISLNEFVFEQDNLFRSQLEEIQTKLNVIYALYDYFKVFNNHSCELNRI
jgi:outer membrane protein TolC